MEQEAGPARRGFVLAILVAIILSVMTTLLLGGSWSSYTLHAAGADSSGGYAQGGPCCPPPDPGK